MAPKGAAMAAIYINNYSTGEDDAVVQGFEWLKGVVQQQHGESEAATFSSKFKEIYADQGVQYGPLLDLFVKYSKDLFGAIVEGVREEAPGRPKVDIKEVESFFALVLSILQQLEEVEHLDSATTHLCKLFSSNPAEQPDLRLRLLMMLYNTFLPNFDFRYRIFKCIVDFGAQAKLFDQVLPYLEYLDSWMEDWEDSMTLDDKRELFLDISKYMRDLGKRVDAFEYLKRYHVLSKNEPAAKLKEKVVHEATVQLLKDAIQIPSVIQFDDLLAFETVKALKGTPEQDLIEICNVFLSGTVNDLRAVQKKHSKLFDQHKLKMEDAMSKIRLLTLASICHGRSEITLAEVAKELEESEENVERWVVRGISEGVINARIDQLKHKVLVKSAFQRKFEKEEWAFLDSKLSNWIDNLEHVIKFIGEQKQLREASGAPP